MDTSEVVETQIDQLALERRDDPQGDHLGEDAIARGQGGQGAKGIRAVDTVTGDVGETVDQGHLEAC